MDRARNQDQNSDRTKGRCPWSGSGLRLSYWLLGGLLLIAGLAPICLAAQTNTAKGAAPNRCLLIVDTSNPMQRRSKAMVKVVEELVTSGLNGQLRHGDSLGLWTFNEALHAGRFPLQTWSPDDRRAIAERIVAFLKAQKYEKQPSFDKVRTALTHVVENSPRLTVILISSGDETVRGTPYDQQIAQRYREWYDQQRKARMPFVTVLRAQDGRFVDCVVNTPPWPLQIPAAPPEMQTAQVTQGQLQEALQRTARDSNVPPPLVIKKESPPVSPPASRQDPPSIKTNTPAAATAAGPTNQLPTIEPPTQSAPATQAVGQATAQAVPSLVSTQSSSKPAPIPAPLVDPNVEIVKAPTQNQAKPMPPEVAPATTSPAAETKPAGADAPQPSAVAKTTPALPPSVALTERSATGASATVATSMPARSASVVAPTVRHSTSPAQTATATPVIGFISRNLLWFATLAVVIAVGGFALLRLRRSRVAPQGSLITRSYERARKP
ncbi:MAG TPA: hypothetical protein P5205_12940 [Candidatus Paceibacterota bacterium]|nr:hypothetical protein [Verrucomicrobiota bacterium]HSA11267.1 hypothetical protein [Candidatus Paceibacterota bacterium]